MAEAKDGVTMISCVLALLLFASVAVAQTTPATVAGTAATEARVAAPEAAAPTAPASSPSEKTPAGPPTISYVGGQLRIEAFDSTLRDILTKVAAVSGVKIDIPAGASSSERLRVVKLGPGPARQILASLLKGSDFDYLILASATDPEGIQNVVLMPREKRGSGDNGADLVARQSPSRYPRAIVSPLVSPSRSDETPESNSPVPAPPDNTTAQMTPAPTQPDPSAPSPPDQSAPSPPTQPDQPVLSPAALSNRSGLTSAGAMSPPPALDSQSINQQLQQMYQQRMQMTQQDRQSVPPPPPAANPGSQ